jgi:hypothetical protein
MPSFGVTITTNTTPAIIVDMSGNTTYAQFKQSLGQYVYDVITAYLYSSNLPQIQNVFLYNKYDSDGNQYFRNIISAISPYQSANSIYLDTENQNVVIDGRDTIDFTMLPNTTLQIKLYVERISNGDEFDDRGINEFIEISDLIIDYNFFDDYKDML